MLKVEALEAGAGERQEQPYVLNARLCEVGGWGGGESDAHSHFLLSRGWHAGRAVGNMRALFISWLRERACLYVSNQQKGKGVAGPDH